MEVCIKNASYFRHQRMDSVLWMLSLNKIFKTERELLLNDINLTFKPGTITAIIGMGQGISGLLDVLSIRQTEGFLYGTVLHDNEERIEDYYVDIAYVPPTNANSCFDTLTVFEYLFFGARLRTLLSLAECREKARDVIKLVGLDGGLRLSRITILEQRLLGIAVELVGQPSLLVIASPTENLEASDCTTIYRVLRKITSRYSGQITIIISSDGLNEDMTLQIDQICIFSGVSCVFSKAYISCPAALVREIQSAVVSVSNHVLRWKHQKSNKAAEFDLQRMCGELNKLCEQYVSKEVSDLVSVASTSSATSQAFRGHSNLKPANNSLFGSIINMFSSSKDSATLDSGHVIMDDEESDGKPSNIRQCRSLYAEISIVLSRTWLFFGGHKAAIYWAVCKCLAVGAILGLFAYKDGESIKDQVLITYPGATSPDGLYGEEGIVNESAYNVTSCLFCIVATLIVGPLHSIQFMHNYAQVIKSEIYAGYLQAYSCWICIILFDIPIQLLISTVMSILIYTLLSLQGSFKGFFFAIVFTSIVGNMLATVCAVICSSARTASQAFIFITTTFILSAGYIRFVYELPTDFGSEGIARLSGARWAFESLMVNAYSRCDFGDTYLDLYGFAAGTQDYSITLLRCWFWALLLVMLLGLSPNQRKVINVLRASYQKKENEHGFKEAFHSTHAAGSGSANPLTQFRPSKQASSNSNNDLSFHPLHSLTPLSVEDNPFRKSDIPRSLHTTLSFSRIRYTNSDSSRYEADTSAAANTIEIVVQGVTGVIRPGECCCILDGNEEGAGDILLKVLSGRAGAAGIINGVIKGNDIRLGKHNCLIYSSYVAMGDSAQLHHLTVRETLMFAAQLRCQNMGASFNKKKQMPTDGSYGMMEDDVEERRTLPAGKEESFMARLHDKFTLTEENMEHCVEDVLRMMGLLDVADVFIGSEDKRGISPSQLRCLTIGVELVRKPSIIFLENPTFGLDWHHAKVVANAILTLASGGRTVLSTLHKPTKTVMESFDKTLLIGSGHMLYFGDSKKAAEHFENFGFEFRNRDFANPAEFILDIAADRGNVSRAPKNSYKKAMGGTPALSVLDLADVCRSMSHATASSIAASSSDTGVLERDSISGKISKTREKNSSINGNSIELSTGLKSAATQSPTAFPRDLTYHTSLPNSSNSSNSSILPVGERAKVTNPAPGAMILARRALTDLKNDHAYLLNFFGTMFMGGFVLGAVFWNLKDGEYMERMSLFATAFVCTNVLFVDLMQGIHKRKVIFLRERAAGASTAMAYWLSDSTPLQFMNFFGCLCFAAPLYYMAGLRSGIEYFLFFFAMLYGSIYCNLGLCYLVCMLTPDFMTSRLVFNGAIVQIQCLFSGFLILFSSMSYWCREISYMFPMNYYMAGMFYNEFHDNPSAIGENVTYDTLAEMYDYEGARFENLFWLAIIGLVYRLLWLAVLRVWQAVKRRLVLSKFGAARKKVMVLVEGLEWLGRFGRGKSYQHKNSRFVSVEEEILAEIDSGTAALQQQQEANLSSNNDNSASYQPPWAASTPTAPVTSASGGRSPSGPADKKTHKPKPSQSTLDIMKNHQWSRDKQSNVTQNNKLFATTSLASAGNDAPTHERPEA